MLPDRATLPMVKNQSLFIPSLDEESPLIGGDERDRTADLLLARQALSQLSYTPTLNRAFIIAEQIKSKRTFAPYLF